MSGAGSDRPRRGAWRWLALGIAVGLSLWALRWDLSHLATTDGWAAAWTRVHAFAAAFTPPDLSAPTLGLAWRLDLAPLAIARLGVGVGLVFAYPLAARASDAVRDDGAARGGGRAVIRE
ncbi:MAG: hypothetical protein VX044_04220, partial [Planctomycetota bacterium]|nr:hypothetical protein [Planctomycetota bacterium]